MHELNITQTLIQTALAQADLQAGERIERLRIALDPTSGYLPDAIRFYFEQLAQDTAAAGAQLEFDTHREGERIKLLSIDVSEVNREETERWRIEVTGVVQGVGFRPFVHHLARQLGLVGWVKNTSAGVTIEVQGSASQLAHFCDHLQQDAPPLAHIWQISHQAIPAKAPAECERDLQIIASQPQAGSTLISPDVAVCPACLAELFDPLDRRYRYPFLNCTHCGPRFTIIHDLPYDRPNTTMATFPLCPACEQEYHDPDDRRFHAQPVACPVCGPSLSYVARVQAASALRLAYDAPEVDLADVRLAPGLTPLDLLGDALAQTVTCLNRSGLVAIKGLGGFHLACRADDSAAVRHLRLVKHRPAKPLAVMVRNIAEAEQDCWVSETEKALLLSPEAPIVLLRKRAGVTPTLAPEIAPANGYVGVMLPYTPLHHLLLQAVNAPVVMTSGNPIGEPLCIDNQAAIQQLDFVDGYLLHNRPIARRCDDSVVFVAAGEVKPVVQSVRRARGFAPLPVLLPAEMALATPLIATGADLKNVSAVAADHFVYLSQHIGDLSSLGVRDFQTQSLADLERLFHVKPQLIACDRHPDYTSSRYARTRAEKEGLRLIEVQHHHAHIAACAAENQHTGQVIGLAFDGTGYGTDGNIWGGEALLADLAHFERLSHLQYLPLPGGDAGTRKPYRIALAYLKTLLPEIDAGKLLAIAKEERELLDQMLAQQINTPLTSSMGRLFDAVSALLGLCTQATYEAEAAIALENAALQAATEEGHYPIALPGSTIQLAPLFEQLVFDLGKQVPVPVMARRFHNSVAEMAVIMANAARAASQINTVALSGGVWQNRLLLELTIPRLQNAGFSVLLHRILPANDGGIAYGQAVVAARIIRN